MDGVSVSSFADVPESSHAMIQEQRIIVKTEGILFFIGIVIMISLYNGTPLMRQFFTVREKKQNLFIVQEMVKTLHFQCRVVYIFKF